MTLDETYRAYLACLNERRFEALDAFVHDTLLYNDAPMTRADYRDLLVGDVAAIPDLAFVADLLVVRGDHVACRLWFDCTPTGTFHGLEPDGRRVSFAEHVFYRFADGRIAQVWSLIDTDAVRRQLGS
ncbi:ester cyclase [Actinomycetospora sp. C-140]